MSLMKFYMTPGSCSTGIHILLEELGLVFEVYVINLLAGEHKSPEYIALNPKSSIPMLIREDGKVLTEFQAIAYWLARSNPQAGLLGVGLDDEVRILEVMDYVVGTLHMQGFARIFTTNQFTRNIADHDTVRHQGLEMIKQGFSVINDVLGGQDHVSDKFSIADAALFYTEFWARRSNIELPVHCHRHYHAMLNRPVVRQVLMEEGYRI